MKKRLIAALIAVLMLVATGVPAFAASNSQVVTGPETRIWQDGFGFHCNAHGNGATDVEYTGGVKAICDSIAKLKKQPAGSMIVAKGDQKDIFGTKTYPITLQRVGDTTIWDLMTGTDIVCMTCGSTEWVTYSNKNGVINGKNIQGHHPPSFEIEKLWEDGNPDELEALFDVYKWDAKKAVRGEKVLDGVSAGKYRLDEGYYLVVELEKEGYIAQPDQIINVEGSGKKVTFINEPEEPLKEQLRLVKKVIDGEGKLGIVDWLIENGYMGDAFDILFDITFELYESDADGNLGDLIGIGELDLQGIITFTDPDGEYLGLDPGYYVVREVLGPIAADVFEQAADLLIYFNGKVAIAPETKPDFDEDTTFTIQQTSMANGRKVGRLVQVVYEHNDPPNGEFYYHRTSSPAIFGTTFKGGYALETSQFEATQDNGKKFISFCADIGAIGCERDYVIDEDNHGLTDEEVYKLVAALDFIYNNYGLDTIANEEGIALAQLVVWNLVMKYSSNPMIADLWATSVTGTLYKDKYGEIVKIEGNTKATPPWYPVGGEYRTLINDIIADTEKYVEIYEARIALGPEDYIVGAAFLKGDGTRPAHYQQRQLIIWFGGLTFDNIPKDDPLKGTISIEKRITVDEDGQIIDIPIGRWLEDTYGLEAFDIIEGMVFNLYKVDNEGDAVTEPPLLSTELDANSQIIFEDLDPGWYAITEAFEGKAATIFKAPPVWYVLVTQNGASVISLTGHYEAGTVGGGGFDYDAFYTIVNGYGSGYTLGYPGLNNTGDIFPIAVTNVENGESYDSFCANGGSTNFHEGHGNYMVAIEFRDVVEREAANGVDFDDFLKAYNYLFDKYCDEGEDLADLRPVTQIITWYLLGDLEVPSEDFDNINWAAVEVGTGAVKGVPGAKAIVEDVVANYASYKLDKSPGNIVDIVFMVSKDVEKDFITAQPQLVPIYKTGYIINLPEDDPLKGSVSFKKVKYGGQFDIDKLDEFGFDLFVIVDGEEIYIDTYYTDANGLVALPENFLEPGSYVFRELLTADLDMDKLALDVSYRPVWKAIYPNGDDGLYFEIIGKDVVWPEGYELDAEDEDGNPIPTVDNEYYCKHSVLWTVTKETEDSIPFGDGWIRFDDDTDEAVAGSCGRSSYKAYYREATCIVDAYWYMACEVCEAVHGGFYIPDTDNPAKGHEFYYEPVHPMWCTEETAGTLYRRCENCDFSDQIIDRKLWFDMLVEDGINPLDWGFVRVPPTVVKNVTEFRAALADPDVSEIFIPAVYNYGWLPGSISWGSNPTIVIDREVTIRGDRTAGYQTNLNWSSATSPAAGFNGVKHFTIVEGGSLTLDYIIVQGNSSSNQKGGIAVLEGGSLTMIDSKLTNCGWSAGYPSGPVSGALLVDGGTVELINCEISDSYTSSTANTLRGSAILAINGADVTIVDTSFIRNRAINPSYSNCNPGIQADDTATVMFGGTIVFTPGSTNAEYAKRGDGITSWNHIDDILDDNWLD